MKKAEKTRKEIITDTGNRRVVIRQLDLASLKSIRDFASEVNIGEFLGPIHSLKEYSVILTTSFYSMNQKI